MSMSDWDLVENCLMIIMGASFFWFLLASKGKD